MSKILEALVGHYVEIQYSDGTVVKGDVEAVEGDWLKLVNVVKVFDRLGGEDPVQDITVHLTSTMLVNIIPQD